MTEIIKTSDQDALSAAGGEWRVSVPAWAPDQRNQITPELVSSWSAEELGKILAANP